jgi:hypothetical protein
MITKLIKGVCGCLAPPTNGEASGARSMSATKLQELKQMVAELLKTARKLPPGPGRINILRQMGTLRTKIFNLQSPKGVQRHGLKAKEK